MVKLVLAMSVGQAHFPPCEEHGHSHPPQEDLAVMVGRARAFAEARNVPFTAMLRP